MNIIERFIFWITSSRRENKNKQILSNMFSIASVATSDARTLGELMNARKLIVECQETVVEFGSPLWATNRLKILNGLWNKRYRLWKLRG